MSQISGFASALVPVLHVAAALIAGGAIGLERTFHGRAAGFRTYALVCMGSAIVMVVAVFPAPWLGASTAETLIGMSRVVQGILTGVGFIGAGIIVKHGGSIRGLTTAASIWTTAGIGILIGAGYYWEAAAIVLLVLGTLSLFRRIEDRMDKEHFARIKVGVTRAQALSKAELDVLLGGAGLKIEQVSYGLEKHHAVLDYEYVVSGLDPAIFGTLAEVLSSRPEITSYQISPIND